MNCYGGNKFEFLMFKLQLYFLVASFCLAAILFPCGFGADEIGGEPYKLPPNASIGYSYFLFYTSLVVLTMAIFFCHWSMMRRNVFRAPIF